jgi:hypothetical protein
VAGREQVGGFVEALGALDIHAFAPRTFLEGGGVVGAVTSRRPWRARSPEQAQVASGVTAGVLASELHRIRHASERYGRHGSAIAVKSAGVGIAARP